MTTPQLSQGIGRVLPIVGLAVGALVWAVAGADRGVAALVGGALASLNWLALRWLVQRATQGSMQSRGLFMILAVAKMGALIAIVALLIRAAGLDALGLLAGLSVLFIGPVLGAVISATGPAPTAEAVGKEQ